jgi:hypothetical protein
MFFAAEMPSVTKPLGPISDNTKTKVAINPK